MSYLLVDHPNPYTPQGGYPRRGVDRPSGTCIVHTTEGSWQAGVQSLVNLVSTRSDYGCYHRACDWADIALLFPWEWETWQDSETNPWAVGISAACKTSDWGNMPADVEEGYYRNMARMAADFVAYMRDQYGTVVPLVRITGAQARARVPGFAAHGDSGVARSDPGARFDWDKFFSYTAAALGSASAAAPNKIEEEEEEDMALTNEDIDKIADRVLSKVVTDNKGNGQNTLKWFLTAQREGRKEDVKAIIAAIKAAAK